MKKITATKFLKVSLFILGVIGLIASVLWWYKDRGYEPFIAAIGALAAFLGSFAISDEGKKSTDTLDQRNRRVLLNHVDNFWIKGILEKSLYK
jgi:hypothetical protein